MASGASTVTAYTYDQLNRLASVTDAEGTTRYGYNKVGSRTSVLYPNGTSQTYQYDDLNRLVKLNTLGADGTLLKSYGYTLDKTGRRTGIVESDGRTTDYSYDKLYRLTQEVISDEVNGDYSATYQYDKVGNRTYQTVNGIQTAYTYDKNDRLLQAGGLRYTYDDNGNQLTESEDGETITYTYNSKNHLIGRQSDTQTLSYRYNPDGIRHQQSAGLDTESYLVDSNRDYAQVLVEYDDLGPLVLYHYGDDLISQTRGSTTSYYHYDGLGSTRALSDAAGSFTDSYDYEAFGEVLAQSGNTENSYLFTGEQYDEGLDQYYLRARYYDQQVGRFTQMDTWMGRSQDPVTLNKYLYANADPVNYTDPTGHFGLASFGVANNIRFSLTELQLDTGMNILDAALNPESAAGNAGTNMLLGVAALGGEAAFKMMRLLSSKFRKACRPSNSFDGETLVSTEHGLKPITSIKIGDKVWAYDEETGERSLQEVVHLIAGEGEKAIREITLATGEVLTATAGHPFYLPDSEQWVEAQELAEGDQLLTRDGDVVQIAAVNTYFRPAKVYNLTVANDHTYFVGLEEVLAHNAQKVCDLNGIVIGATKPPLVRNPKHASGGAGKRSGHGAGLEPEDSKYAFERLSVKSSKNGNWYAKSPDGKSIYRYFESGGAVHWSGSTGDAMAPLDKSLIPPEIIKTFGFKVKGKNL